jgi:hypothetical protein
MREQRVTHQPPDDFGQDGTLTMQRIGGDHQISLTIFSTLLGVAEDIVISMVVFV